MRKLLLLAAVLLTATACEEQKGDGLYMHSFVVESPQSAWALEDGQYRTNASNHSSVQRYLTREVCEIGAVNAYVYLNDVQVPLPLTRHFEGFDTNNQPILWSETIHYDYDPFGLYFYVTYSDFDYTSARPNYDFRVVLTW